MFKKMIEENSTLFDDFKTVHDELPDNKEELQEPFNEKGTKVMRVIRRYEDALCSKSENTGFGKFSENLSEKFWEEIRGMFPHIDEVQQR
jgi:hypothetical protein